MPNVYLRYNIKQFIFILLENRTMFLVPTDQNRIGYS